MENKNLWKLNLDTHTAFAFALLALLPNLLGLVNIPTPFGFKLHLFQIGIFIAAACFGPLGGLASGLLGSIFPAMLMHNPYILLFNGLLGLFTGLFFRKGMSMVKSAMAAFLIVLPLIIAIDSYAMGMPSAILLALAVSLFASNLAWSAMVQYGIKRYGI